MKIEVRSIIPAHRTEALRDRVERPGCGWVREVLRPEDLKASLYAQVHPVIVLIEAENDLAAIAALLESVLEPQIEVVPAPYVVVMGVGEAVEDAMQLYAAGADEVIEKVLQGPILFARLATVGERLRSVAKAQRVRHRLEDAQKIGNIGSWHFNLLTGDVWWSSQIYKVLNAEPSDAAMGFEAFVNYVDERDRDMVRELMTSAIQDANSCGFEFRIPLPNGKTRRLFCVGYPRLDESGQLVEFEGVIQDIDAQSRVESELRRHQMVVGYISEHLPAALYQIRHYKNNSIKLDYVTVGSLEGFDRLSDYAGKELKEYAYEILEEDRPRLLESTLRAARLHQKWVDEFRVLDDNGEIRWIAGQSTPERLEDGTLLWRGVLLDITERKLLNDQVQHADRLSTIGTMAAGVAHEVNNPLVYLLGNLQFVLELLDSEVFDEAPIDAAEIVSLQGAELEEMRRALRTAHLGAQRIGVIVEDLMTFGRASPVQDEDVDLRKIARSAARMLDSQIRDRARLICELNEIPRLRSNSGQLRQVLVNLLLNAAQAMPVERVEENRIDLRISVHKRVVHIEVEDNGKGIAERDKARLFEPFFTTKALSDGTGLGLYVCRNIVEGMSGEIEVESELGQGSLFRVILPIA